MPRRVVGGWQDGHSWSENAAYMIMPAVICFGLLMQEMSFARRLAPPSAGNSNDIRIAIIAMTISSSINVKGRRFFTLVPFLPSRSCRITQLRPPVKLNVFPDAPNS